MKKITLFLLMFAMVMVSCRKEEVDTNTQIDPVDIDHKFVQTVYGQVKDQLDHPMTDVTVQMDGQSFQTDDNGFFFFDNVAVGNFGVHISAEKEGFLFGGYRLYANEVGTDFVNIVLMDAKNIGSFNSASGGTFDIDDNTSVQFPANAISLNGNAFTGNVNITGAWIDPTAENMMDLNPGDLRGSRTDGEVVILNSYGMIGIELKTDSGEKLQISDGSEAELKFGIPNDILGQAPSTIPLWHFDEEEGLWVEEGSATLEGNQYVGNVSHFSWWNTDFPNPTVDMCIKLIDNSPHVDLEGLHIYVKSLSGFGCASGSTNENGIICGLIPADTELEITVSGHCGEILANIIVGPYTEADSPVLIEIDVDVNSINQNNISGVIYDCDTNTPLGNAYVSFSYSGTTSITVSNDVGSYSHTLENCGEISELIITAADINSAKSGETILNNLNGGSYMADVYLCDDLDELFQLNFDDGSDVLDISCLAEQKTHETVIRVGNDDLLGIEGLGLGTFPASYVGSGGIANNSNVTVEITTYDNVGGLVVGTITGTTSGNNVNFDGQFIAKRIQ